MFVLLVSTVFMFLYEYSAKYYMALYNSLLVFIGTYVGFVLSMILMILRLSPYLFVCGWESMGMASVFLVAYHGGRSLSLFSGSLAWLMNRVGDLCLFGGLMVSLFPIVVLACVCKSSLFLFSPWLGHAMEGPTTVSSLLHSSTMVLARLVLLLGIDVTIGAAIRGLIIVRFLVAFYRRSNRDYKRTMANSTSSQLNFMGVIALTISSGMAFFYMVNHAGFKARFFTLVRAVMHFTRVMKSSVSLCVSKLSSFFSNRFISLMAGLFGFSVACVPKDQLILSCADRLSVLVYGMAIGSFIYSKILGLTWDTTMPMLSVLVYVMYTALHRGGRFRAAEARLRWDPVSIIFGVVSLLISLFSRNDYS